MVSPKFSNLRLKLKRIHNASSYAKSPGKIILTGEHSVVYKGMAIAAPIDQWLEIRVNHKKTSQAQNDSYWQYIKKILTKKFDLNLDGVDYQILSSLPMKAGLGSSAAFASAVIQAILKFYQIQVKKEELFQFVLEAEKFVHGNPSGIDPATVVYQNFIDYSKSQGVKILDNVASLPLLLINSGSAVESTKDMVNLVAKRKKSNSKIDLILDDIHKVSQKMRQALAAKNNQKELMFLLDRNQKLLDELGVVGQKAREIVSLVRQSGGAAKITGAGGLKSGSGYILALHQDLDYLSARLTSQGIIFRRITLS